MHPVLSLGVSCSWAANGRSQGQRDAWDTNRASMGMVWAFPRDVGNFYFLFSSGVFQSCRVRKYDHYDGVGQKELQTVHSRDNSLFDMSLSNRQP